MQQISPQTMRTDVAVVVAVVEVAAGRKKMTPQK
jgi:hypothetical protein